MKLDRNGADGRGKYGVVKVRRLKEIEGLGTSEHGGRQRALVLQAVKVLERAGVLTFGGVGAPDEFFVLMLKDRYSDSALAGYVNAIRTDQHGDAEYHNEIDEMWTRAGRNSPHCKRPD